jgi:membrane-bound lytic murein transglycosylase D
MRNKLYKLFFLFAIIFLQKSLYAQDTTNTISEISEEALRDEDAIIDEIVETRSTPRKDKVQYFSKLTRYGFKNLFPAYNYTPTQSYAAQVNPNAEKYMQDYLRTRGKSLVSMKGWCMPYFNLIDNIFTQYGLPKELKYLAVIESNLKPTATSWVGAAGPWQFMPYTGREMGLIVNGTIDERRDYFKSTHAAARYLLQLYKQTKDWLLVIAAYNGGPGRVFSAIRNSGSRNFWQLQYHLPEESRNHVKKFIATHYIMEANGGMSNINVNAAPIANYPTNTSTTFETNTGFATKNTKRGKALNPYNNKPTISVDEMQQAETQMITGKYNSVIIAKNLVIDILTFNRYNPLFDKQIEANGKYELILPEAKMQLFLSIKYQILNECVNVLLGDTQMPENILSYPSRGKKKRK